MVPLFTAKDGRSIEGTTGGDSNIERERQLHLVLRQREITYSAHATAIAGTFAPTSGPAVDCCNDLHNYQD